MTLPYFQTDDRSLSQLQTTWKSQLDPILADAILQGLQLSNIAIKTGVNVINHMLQRNQQGWFITDIDAASTLYRSQAFNSLTLTLTSSAPCNVSLWVY